MRRSWEWVHNTREWSKLTRQPRVSSRFLGTSHTGVLKLAMKNVLNSEHRGSRTLRLYNISTVQIFTNPTCSWSKNIESRKSQKICYSVDKFTLKMKALRFLETSLTLPVCTAQHVLAMLAWQTWRRCIACSYRCRAVLGPTCRVAVMSTCRLRARDLSPLLNVQTGCGAQLVYYLRGTGRNMDWALRWSLTCF